MKRCVFPPKARGAFVEHELLRGLRALLAERCDAPGGQGVEELADLVRAMLQYEPSRRISAAATLSHPFLTMDLAMPPGTLGGGAALMDPTPEPALPAAAAMAALAAGGAAAAAAAAVEEVGPSGSGAQRQQQQQWQQQQEEEQQQQQQQQQVAPPLEAGAPQAGQGQQQQQQQQPGPGPPLGWPPGGGEGRLEAAEAAGQTGDVGA
ncbi:hypothetical protein MNEG_14806 [Monoraphidium neglectum]|uniref:Protein kinase domain-containing protein n=1 Tax=Monoraphidium neglectum TaxID=145388 RepID=A0A0D2LU60_9CHLO|nr:hypothetical protein MNEG_14806 [Monoraphidium neglectum]KIY93156.1 hypothetical protein MNEG_14806 [Monoraphidium neglectum]|eukprot:XP_013892176.1 hypothetical protein MNEG_14806 [Monoraphidium neglectum]